MATITERRRVLFASYTAEWTGPTKSLSLLLEHLRESYEIGVAYTGRGRLEEVLRSLEVQGHRLAALDKWRIPALARVVRDGSYDLVYANNTHGSSRNAFLASLISGRPFVCHVRGMAWDKSWLRLGYLRFADGVVAVSRACARSVERFVRGGRLHVVHNGVAEETFETSEGQETAGLREALRLGEESLLVVSVAHICERKGQLDAVAALGELRKQELDVHLCLVGSTEREPAYVHRVREEARRSRVSERLHLLGFREDVRAILNDADVFLHTALEDPHPRAVIEAMAAGLPVVGWSVDGVSETVVDGETGRLVELGDLEELAAGLSTLARNPEMRGKWGEEGRERARSRFSARSTARGVGAVIDGILTNRANRSAERP